MATRTPPQPAITGPLQKKDRALLVGDEGTPAQGTAAEEPQPVPQASAEVPRKDAGAPRAAKRTQADDVAQKAADEASPAEAPDPLLAALLAGRSPARGVPITRLEPELHGTLRLIAARSGVSIQELVNGAVRAWLNDNQQRLVDAGILER